MVEACAHTFVRESIEVTEIMDGPEQTICFVVQCGRCGRYAMFGVGAGEMDWGPVPPEGSGDGEPAGESGEIDG